MYRLLFPFAGLICLGFPGLLELPDFCTSCFLGERPPIDMQLLTASVLGLVLLGVAVAHFIKVYWEINDPNALPGPTQIPYIGRIHDLPINFMWLKFKEWRTSMGQGECTERRCWAPSSSSSRMRRSQRTFWSSGPSTTRTGLSSDHSSTPRARKARWNTCH